MKGPRLWFAATLLIGLSGCLREDHVLWGLACESDAECGAQGRCRERVCAPAGAAASPPETDGGHDAGGERENLLTNGGFESGLGGWSSLSDSQLREEETVVRTGGKSLRVDASGSSSSVGMQLDKLVLMGITPETTYCVEAFVQRGNVTKHFTLIARRYSDLTSSSGWVDSARNPGAILTPVDDQWVRLVERITTGPDDIAINFRLYTESAAGLFFFVDDVRIWIDPSGECLG